MKDSSGFSADRAVVLSHGSALHYYETLDPENRQAAKPTKGNPLRRATASISAMRRFNVQYSGFGGAPLDVLVPEKGLSRESAAAKAHYQTSNLPARSFWKLCDELFIVSPELCFLQAAQTRSGARLVEVGANLCGCFYRNLKADDSNGLPKLPVRNPITTPEKLANYLDHCHGLPGVARAKDALKTVLPNSRSPMETKLYVLLCTAKRRGGFGLPLPQLNYEVDPGRLRSLVEQSCFSVDLCWPDLAIGLEYFGEGYHGADLHVKDRRRINGLETLGWTIEIVDKRMIFDPAAFELVVKQIARGMDYRFRKTRAWEAKHKELRRDLDLA